MKKMNLTPEERKLVEGTDSEFARVTTASTRPKPGDTNEDGSPTDASYESRIASVYKRMLARAETWITTNFPSEFEPYHPLDDLNMLIDDVYHNGILNACNNYRALAVGRLGFKLAPNPFVAGEAKEAEKPEMRKWIMKTFHPSFQTAMYRRNKDYYDTGLGALLLDHNIVPIKDAFSGDHIGYEISKIRHINRMRIAPLKPKMETMPDGKQRPNVADMLFPRWIVKIGDDTHMIAKSFGDPRHIHKWTGEISEKPLGTLSASSIMWKAQYHPKDEICGWPDWYTEKLSIEISWLIQSYEWGHFVTNCMPNLIVIMPEVDTKGGKALGTEVKEWFQDIANKREDSHGVDHRSAMVIEFPIRSFKDVRHLPLLIQEIKGPDADQFLDLGKSKNHRIAVATGVPPALIHAESGSLGSGKDKEADLARHNELQIIPEQETEEIECLDPIIMNGTKFRSWVIRLNRIDTSDPEKVAKVAETWSRVWFANMAEARTKAGLDGPLSDDAELNQKIGNILLMPSQASSPMTIDQLWKLATEAALMFAEDPEVAKKVTEDDDPDDDENDTTEEKKNKRIKRFIRYIDKNFGRDPQEFFLHAMPAIQEFVEKRTK